MVSPSPQLRAESLPHQTLVLGIEPSPLLDSRRQGEHHLPAKAELTEDR